MESNVQVVKKLLAISVFSGFVGWDIVRACKRRDKRIQGTGLTLTALSVQFLAYFDAQTISRQSKEAELKTLVKNQLSVDMSRLVFCTFLACVLPGVAFHSSGVRWSNIAAIALSLCLHMATEFYVLQNYNDPEFSNGGRAWFISSSVLLLVAAITLVLYIGLAIICCKFTRDRLNLQIPQMLTGRVTGENHSKMLKECLKNKVFKYWAIVRGCQQEFWLVSSALSPPAAFIVTKCVAVVAVKAISHQYLLRSSSNSMRWTLSLQCIFIIAGWAILIWRWAVFLLLSVSRKDDFFAYRAYNKIFVKRFLLLVYLFVHRSWNWSTPLDDSSWWKSIVIYVWKPVRKPVLIFMSLMVVPPIALFSVILCLLVLFNFFCWWLSKLLASCVHVFPSSKKFIECMKTWVSDAEEKVDTKSGQRLYLAQSSLKRTGSKMVVAKRAKSAGK